VQNPAAAEAQQVILGGQAAEIVDADRGRHAAGIRARGRRLRCAGGEQLAAELPGGIEARRLLGVGGVGDGDRDLTQLIDGRIDRLGARREQAAEIARGDLPAQEVAGVVGRHDLELPGVERIADRGERRGRTLQHQRHAVGDEHVQGAAGVADRGDPGQFRQVRHQVVALIDECERRLAAGVGRVDHDLLVQRRDRAGQRIDLFDVGRNAGVDAVVQVLQLRGRALEGARDGLRLALQRLARRRRGRIVGECRPGIVVILQRRRQAARGGADDVVDLIGVALQRVELCQAALRTRQLVGRKLVVGAAHAGDDHPRADRYRAVRQRRRRGEIDALLGIARRVRVRDVVAGHRDGVLERLQCRDADAE